MGPRAGGSYQGALPCPYGAVHCEPSPLTAHLSPSPLPLTLTLTLALAPDLGLAHGHCPLLCERGGWQTVRIEEVVGHDGPIEQVRGEEGEVDLVRK